MRHGSKLLVSAILLTVAGAAAHAYWPTSVSYRFRMTVEVDTPQGLRTGSSVMEVHAGKLPGLLPDEKKADIGLNGEAVTVDLPGGTLFVLLPWSDGGHSMGWIATKTLDSTFTGGADGFLKTVPKLSHSDAAGRSGVVAPANYPPMVRFATVTDPLSVAKVDPANLRASFGGNPRIKKIFVTVTIDPVTSKIHEIIPWLGNSVVSNLDRNFKPTTEPTLAQLLSDYNFRQGVE